LESCWVRLDAPVVGISNVGQAIKSDGRLKEVEQLSCAAGAKDADITDRADMDEVMRWPTSPVTA
jgi:hypothetical protein